MKKFKLNGQRNCETLSFETSPVTVGRSAQATVILRNILISREHCHIIWQSEKNAWAVHDKSSSGTYINEALVGKNKSQTLNHGDALGLGPSTEANSILWMFEFPQEEISCLDEQDSIDLSRLDCQSQAITDLNHEKSNLESQITEKMQNLSRMKEEYEQKEKQFNERLKNAEERNIIHPEKKIKIQSADEDWMKEQKAIKEQWETQKKQLLEEMASNKAAEDDLKNEVNRLQASLDAEKAQWQQKMDEMKLQVEEADRSKMDAVQATKEQMAAASDQVQEALKQRLHQEEEEKKLLNEKLKQMEKDLVEADSRAKANHANQQEKQIEEFQSELQCVICSELFMTAMTLNCMHTFCKYCLSQWTKNNKTCPTCRAGITSTNRSLVTDNVVELVVSKLSEEMKTTRQELVNERKQLENPPPAPARRGRASTRGGRARGRGGVNRTTAAQARAAAAAERARIDAAVQAQVVQAQVEHRRNVMLQMRTAQAAQAAAQAAAAAASRSVTRSSNLDAAINSVAAAAASIAVPSAAASNYQPPVVDLANDTPRHRFPSVQPQLLSVHPTNQPRVFQARAGPLLLTLRPVRYPH